MIAPQPVYPDPHLDIYPILPPLGYRYVKSIYKILHIYLYHYIYINFNITFVVIGGKM